jgi:hypothetical protein
MFYITKLPKLNLLFVRKPNSSAEGKRPNPGHPRIELEGSITSLISRLEGRHPL